MHSNRAKIGLFLRVFLSIPLIFECNPSPFPVYDVEAEAVEVAEVVAPSGASSSMSSVSRFRGMGSRGKRNPSHAFVGSREGFRPSYFGVFGALRGSPWWLSAVGSTACPFSHIGESEGKKRPPVCTGGSCGRDCGMLFRRTAVAVFVVDICLGFVVAVVAGSHLDPLGFVDGLFTEVLLVVAIAWLASLQVCFDVGFSR